MTELNVLCIESLLISQIFYVMAGPAILVIMNMPTLDSFQSRVLSINALVLFLTLVSTWLYFYDRLIQKAKAEVQMETTTESI